MSVPNVQLALVNGTSISRKRFSAPPSGILVSLEVSSPQWDANNFATQTITVISNVENYGCSPINYSLTIDSTNIDYLCTGPCPPDQGSFSVEIDIYTANYCPTLAATGAITPSLFTFDDSSYSLPTTSYTLGQNLFLQVFATSSVEIQSINITSISISAPSVNILWSTSSCLSPLQPFGCSFSTTFTDPVHGRGIDLQVPTNALLTSGAKFFTATVTVNMQVSYVNQKRSILLEHPYALDIRKRQLASEQAVSAKVSVTFVSANSGTTKACFFMAYLVAIMFLYNSQM